MKRAPAIPQRIFRVELGAHSLVPPARAMRQTPRYWKIEDPDAAWDSARGMCWLVLKTLVAAALVVVAYAVVAS